MFRRGIALRIALPVLAVLVLLYRTCGEAERGFQCPPEVIQASEQHSSRWHPKNSLVRLRGVALVVHGLNLNPERMGTLIRVLNGAGIDALNVSLYGHGENYVRRPGQGAKEARLDSFRSVSYRLWHAELGRAYRAARERSARKRVPLFLVGYSLGALLGCDLLISDADVHFDRMALFAPALNAAIESYLLKPLLPFPGIVIDSLSPGAYRSNDGTPMAAYRAFFDALDHFQRHKTGRLNVPTIVFMDRQDEFISCGKLEEMIVRERLDRWTVAAVEKDPRHAGRTAHHLVIDEPAMGRQAWTRIADSLLGHLLPQRQRPAGSRR